MSVYAFNLAIDRFVDQEVPAAVNDALRVVSIQALRGVVLRSPVDTGRFRGGWEVTINARSYDSLRPVDKSGNATIEEGLGRLSTLPPFATVFLQNNVEYSQVLEDGGSKQAPLGILSVTVADIEGSI